MPRTQPAPDAFGRLVRITRVRRDPTVAYIVAEQDAALAIALVRQMTGSEVEDCGRVSEEVLKFLKLKPGEAKALAPPPHSSWTSKISTQAPYSKESALRHGTSTTRRPLAPATPQIQKEPPMKPGTHEQDRQTEDDIARKKLGPRGVPGAPDTAKITPQEEKNIPKSGEFDGHTA